MKSFGFAMLSTTEGGIIKVFDVVAGSTAWESGIEPDMVVTEVNGIWVLGKGYHEVMCMIERTKGTLFVRFASMENGDELLRQQNAVIKIQQWYRANREGYFAAKATQPSQSPTNPPTIVFVEKVEDLMPTIDIAQWNFDEVEPAQLSLPQPASPATSPARRSPPKGPKTKKAKCTVPRATNLKPAKPKPTPSPVAKQPIAPRLISTPKQAKTPKRTKGLRALGVTGVKGAHRVPDAMKRLSAVLSGSEDSSASSDELGPMSPSKGIRAYSRCSSCSALTDTDAGSEIDRSDVESRSPVSSDTFSFVTRSHNPEEDCGPMSPTTRTERFRAAQTVEGGERLRICGSKLHAKHMGVYYEVQGTFNGFSVYRRVSNSGTVFMYQSKKQWRLSPVVGRARCIISTASTEKRICNIKSVWSEVTGTKRDRFMKPLPSLKVQAYEAVTKGSPRLTHRSVQAAALPTPEQRKLRF